MQFWCSTKDTAWTWQWTGYYGVWLFLILFAVLLWMNDRNADRRSGTRHPMHPWRVIGLLILWLALDWPIGALGAGYLASVHMLQFVMIALLAAPALVASLSPSVGTSTHPVAQWLTKPVVSLLVFNAVVLLTHMPPIVDGLMATQLGNMTIDLAWLLSGALFWWPVLRPTPEGRRFAPPLRMLYLLVGLMFSPIMFGLAGFMVYSPRPLYATYELAPPIPGLSAKDDLQLAGTLMSIAGAIAAFTGLTTIFFRWSREDG